MGIITVPDLSIKVDLVDLKIYQIFCLSKMGSWTTLKLCCLCLKLFGHFLKINTLFRIQVWLV